MVSATERPSGAAARLDELGAVTSEYARYSRELFGLALSLAGLWGLGAVVVGPRWRTAGALGMYLTPLVWLVALRLTRPHYRGHGEVEPVLPIELRWYERPGRVVALVLTGGGCVVGILDAAAFGLPWLLGSVAALATVPVVAARVSRSRGDAEATLGATMFAVYGAPGPCATETWSRVLLSVLASLWIVGGVWQHVRYRRLERRLAALKGGAP